MAELELLTQDEYDRLLYNAVARAGDEGLAETDADALFGYFESARMTNRFLTLVLRGDVAVRWDRELKEPVYYAAHYVPGFKEKFNHLLDSTPIPSDN
jgi:hypothetical protein